MSLIEAEIPKCMCVCETQKYNFKNDFLKNYAKYSCQTSHGRHMIKSTAKPVEGGW